MHDAKLKDKRLPVIVNVEQLHESFQRFDLGISSSLFHATDDSGDSHAARATYREDHTLLRLSISVVKSVLISVTVHSCGF